MVSSVSIRLFLEVFRTRGNSGTLRYCDPFLFIDFFENPSTFDLLKDSRVTRPFVRSRLVPLTSLEQLGDTVSLFWGLPEVHIRHPVLIGISFPMRSGRDWLEFSFVVFSSLTRRSKLVCGSVYL